MPTRDNFMSKGIGSTQEFTDAMLSEGGLNQLMSTDEVESPADDATEETI